MCVRFVCLSVSVCGVCVLGVCVPLFLVCMRVCVYLCVCVFFSACECVQMCGVCECAPLFG